MSDGYSYIIEMVDRISGPAKTAQQQVQALSGKFNEQVEAIKKLEAEHKKLADQGPVSAAETKKFDAAISKAQGSVQGLADKIRGSVSSQQKQSATASQAAAKNQLAAGATGELGASLEALGPIAAVAGAALLAFVGAAASLLFAGAKLALEASEFKNDTLDALEALTGSAEQAQATFDITRKIVADLPITEEKGFDLAKRLLNAGVGQEQMAEALKAAANLQQITGEAGVSKLEKIIEKASTAGKFTINPKQLVGTGVQMADLVAKIAKKTGKSIGEVQQQLAKGGVDAAKGIDALNEAINDKLGGLAAKQMTDIGVQVDKFKDNVRQLFEDVKVDGFLQALTKVGALFTSSTVTGVTLKEVVTRVFSGLFAAAQAWIPYMVFMLKEVVIVALKIEIAFKPVVSKLKEMWATGEQGEAFKTVLKALVDVVVYLVGGIALGIGYWLIFASYAIQFWAAVISYGIAAGTAIGDVMISIGNFIRSLFTVEGWQAIGNSLIDGLVAGVTGGAGAFIAAITGVAKGGITAAKQLLGIASPSKVFADIGGNTAEGFAQGVDDGTARTQGSLEDAVAAPGKAAGGPAAAGGGMPPINIEIHINGGGAGAAEIAELAAAKMTEAVEELWMQFGGGPAKAPA